VYRTTLLLTVGILPVVLLASVFQIPLVNLIYGETYAPSVRSLSILLPSIAVIIFGELARYILIAMKRDRYLPPLLVGAVLLNVAANLVLIPRWGGTGAAIATLVSEAALTLVCLQVLIKLGYQRIGWTISAITLLGLCIVALPSLLLNSLVSVWIGGLGILGVGAIAFLLRPQHFLKASSQHI